MTDRTIDPKFQEFLSTIGSHSNSPETPFDISEFFSDTANREIIPEGERCCPICREKMMTQVVHEVRVDVCDAHGMWLDKSEIPNVLYQAHLDQSQSAEKRHQAELEKASAKAGWVGFFLGELF